MTEPGGLIRSLAGRMAARNFHSYVISEIGENIVSGKYPVGSSLPNDAEMMAHFEVSRTVLREALKTLESKGLVEARPKVGTKVAPRSRWNHFDPAVLAWLYAAGPDEKLLRQLTDVRLAMEPRAAAEVARIRTADDLRMMHYWLRQLENSSVSPLNAAIADYELHVIIADASRNNFMRSLVGIVEFSHTCAYRRMVEKDEPVPKSFGAMHAELLQAIERGDASEAQGVMDVLIRQDLAHGLTKA